MIGARLVAVATEMENAGSEDFRLPSEAEIVMAENVPVAVGVPLSRPVDVLKEAQAGLFAMLNVSACPSGSDALGENA